MIAVNSVKEFRYRIISGKVFELDVIHCGTTIGRQDGTFAFSIAEFDHDYSVFEEHLKREINSVQNSQGLRLHTDNGRVDLIRHTTLPWLSFTAIMHPTKLEPHDSVPKISFGKAHLKEGRMMLPVSVEAHHGLIDGVHIAHYMSEFQRLLQTPAGQNDTV